MIADFFENEEYVHLLISLRDNNFFKEGVVPTLNKILQTKDPLLLTLKESQVYKDSINPIIHEIMSDVECICKKPITINTYTTFKLKGCVHKKVKKKK